MTSFAIKTRGTREKFPKKDAQGRKNIDRADAFLIL